MTRKDRVRPHRERWREDNSCGAALPCPECGTPLDEVPFRECVTHRAADADPAHPSELAMDEIPFAPAEVHLPQAADGLGFIDRASTPVSAMRRSIHRSHRGEGHNFVD